MHLNPIETNFVSREKLFRVRFRDYMTFLAINVLRSNFRGTLFSIVCNVVTAA
jgi:hypothetical protein